MKKKFLFLVLLLIAFIIIDLTHFSTDWNLLSILIPQFRMPRTLVVLIAGTALAMAGFIIQTVVDNPLADAGTLGITSGASAGAVLFLFISQWLKLSGTWIFMYPLFALLGAVFSFALLYHLALRKNVSNIQVLLIGLGITALFQALITLAQLSINRFDFQQVAVWLSGDIWQTDKAFIGLTFVLLIIGLLFFSLIRKELDLLSLGQEMATSLGLNVKKSKMQFYILALLFASIGVLLVGGLAFIGLIAPHIARELVGFESKKRALTTALVSMIILLLADSLSQIIIAPSSLPLGFVVALIGAPYYIYLIQKI
ncbi:FecCD family ABC transporter permease [Lactococcus formosensis]|jgi:iron complex transport system permease protein|uniref:FecCD family ABC transporter permease n=1 Tax=Lactococcus formosensis TaxID=1281486 RepID=UPI0002F6C307|nr:iron ABC transporter permease [Lactococcus formosensis]MDG6112788.1 iron ABC transporter permease [Lactococcus formosensis]MDG6115202.1 iron ABC transporter permease [Lactococcus formosensis]MDG6121353.1 iron ABC transporter permease [Lactococcus formosensis]MDG6124262.1 iron ABC transporter permease [Lactococcus formosensis]MDG6127509.1 iron ABC transporter permease [Lactococcus formosensis]